ncbi:hypothetical protein BaRGS_00010737 [Batillaria attramentaria]|uniref:Uncharacterized protein n=1 Tax=Batillaria attramentaria TaxID=370345 RepID=A0ABD0LF00_9CAEN
MAVRVSEHGEVAEWTTHPQKPPSQDDRQQLIGARASITASNGRYRIAPLRLAGPTRQTTRIASPTLRDKPLEGARYTYLPTSNTRSGQRPAN